MYFLSFIYYNTDMQTLMEQEILEQPSIFGDIVKRYVKEGSVLIDFPNKYKKINFIASGSSYNCARMAKKFFRDMAGLDTSCDFSSEFLANKTNKVDKNALYFFISQSGETSDTIAVMEKVKQGGAKTFALVNVENSKMYKNADYKLCVNAGVERAIAATKSYSACLLCCYLIASKLSEKPSEHLKYITGIGKITKEFLQENKQIDECAKFLSKQKRFPLIGYNYYYILAKEGSLKIKETSYIDVNAYSLGEFVHGHIAILNEIKAILEIFTHDMGEFEMKNLKKIKDDYNPQAVVITDLKSDDKKHMSIVIPKCKNPVLKYILITLTLQMLALKIAQKLKKNIDKPTGLKKVIV